MYVCMPACVAMSRILWTIGAAGGVGVGGGFSSHVVGRRGCRGAWDFGVGRLC